MKLDHVTDDIVYDTLMKTVAQMHDQRLLEIFEIEKNYAIRIPLRRLQTSAVQDWCKETCVEKFLVAPELSEDSIYSRDHAVYFASLADAALFKLAFL